MTVAGQIPIGATTNANGNAESGIFFGNSGKPLLMEIDGTSATAINVISGRYLR
jgi:hypothetical protein